MIIQFSMKDQNNLQDELTKLKEISNLKVDTSFISGYLSFALPLPFAKEIVNMVEDGLISHQNALQIMTVLKINVLGRNPKDLMKEIHSSIQTYMNELALDNFYLQNKYFRRELEKQEMFSQSLGIQCPICSVDIQSMQLCYLSCGHMYHTGCLNAHCRQKISNKIIPIPCPSQNCKSQLLQQQITHFLQHDLRQKYDEFAFHNYVENHMDDTSWCPTPGCSAVFAFDQALTNYKCPACTKHYCLTCKCEFHNGFTCQQYKKVANLSQDDKQFMFLVKGAKYKQCPNCKFWVQKNEGCDHMTCRCKYQFCYVCGGKYNRCKCKGFVNQVQEPKLLEEIPLERPQQIKPPAISVPSRATGIKPFARTHIYSRPQFLPRPQDEVRKDLIRPRIIVPPVLNKRQSFEEEIQQLRLMQERQQEQMMRKQQEQMQRALKLSQEQSIKDMIKIQEEKPKQNIRMKEENLLIEHQQKLSKIKQMTQKWKIKLNQKQPSHSNKSWRPQIKQAKEALMDKKQTQFKEFSMPQKESEPRHKSFLRYIPLAFSQKAQEIKSNIFSKFKKEEIENKPNQQLKEIKSQFKYPFLGFQGSKLEIKPQEKALQLKYSSFEFLKPKQQKVAEGNNEQKQ